MFLNDIGQPLILDPIKKYAPLEQHNGPLLLTSAAFKEHTIPTKFCRRVVGSVEDVTWFQSNIDKKSEYNYIVLRPNEPNEIDCGKIKTTLTSIPAGPFAHVYLLKNGWTNILVAENLSDHLDFIPKASTYFHFALKEGIDVMYIDDKCYSSNDVQMQKQRDNIYALVQLIRPKHLLGLRESSLPTSLQDLCAFKDSFFWPGRIALLTEQDI